MEPRRGARPEDDGDDHEATDTAAAAEDDDAQRRRRLRRQKWQETEARHQDDDDDDAAAGDAVGPAPGEALKGGSVAVAATAAHASFAAVARGGGAIIGGSSGRCGGPHKPSDRWSKDESKPSLVSSNNNSDEGEEGEGDGDDLFPALDNPAEDSNDASTTDEPMQAIIPFNDAKAKIGDLFANRKPPPAGPANDDVNAVSNDPILLPPSDTCAPTTTIKRKRATGLGNLGNTCFMNSTLQCLAHTIPLREYFLSGKFVGDLNTDNPLGTGGELAKEFATLLGQMWQIQKKEGGNAAGGGNGVYSSSRTYSMGSYDSGLSSVTYPRSFKHTLGKHAEQFVGYDQHDSQELAIYLLDALHEDTNRVRKKPYVEKPEQAENEPDDAAAAKAWEVHLRREDSRILESFMGQIKSRLRCPTEGCGRVSTTFDPSMYLSVPIPGSTDRLVKVTFMPLSPMAGGGGRCPASADMSIKLCKNSTVKVLRERVVEMARECYGFDESELCEEDVQFADIFQQNVWSYHEEDQAIDGIKDSDVTFAYQLFPLTRVKEECKAYQAKQAKEAKIETTPGGNDSSGAADATASSSLSSLLDPALKQELDADPLKWQGKLENFIKQSMTLYRITNERRSTHEERLGFYGKLLKFIQKCKRCSDAAPTPSSEDGDIVMNTGANDEEKKENKEFNRNDSSSQTLDEVSFSSSQFQNVRTPRDLALLEYCASKLLANIHELKNPSTRLNSKKKKGMDENGIVVQLKIKKSDGATNTASNSYSTGVGYHNRHNSYGNSLSSWKTVGEPIVVRISPTLTVGGLRKMLGQRVSSAVKLKNHHNEQDASMTGAAAPLMTPEMIMKQVAFSYTNNKGSNNRYGCNTLGSVAEDQLMKGHEDTTHTALFAKSSDKEENDIVSSIVEDEGTIYVSWPPQLNDIFEEDMLFAKDEFLTEQQKKEQESASNQENKVSVMDCIAKYCETEQLEESDMWYCNRCKDFVRAWKQFHLYRTPPILIIHLKRFHFSSTTHRRDKIDTLIDFPLVDLDLRDIVKHWEKGGSGGEEQPPIYDCYAVSNHFGGLGGGHYTAYAKGDDGTWCNFDDSRVTTGVDESEVVSSAAYCLYYKRKDVVFEKANDREDGDAVMESPSPCIEDRSGPESPRGDDNYGTSMEIDNQDDDGSAASYATPSSSPVLHQPVIEKEDDTFYDLQ